MSRIKDTERIKLIAEYIKTKQQPDGYVIREMKNGQYRVSRAKTDREILEQKRERLQRQLDEINKKVKELDDKSDNNDTIDKEVIEA